MVTNEDPRRRGEGVDGEPTAHSVKVYGTAAIDCYDSAGRDARVIVRDLMETETWTDRETQKKRTQQVVEVVVEELVELLDGDEVSLVGQIGLAGARNAVHLLGLCAEVVGVLADVGRAVRMRGSTDAALSHDPPDPQSPTPYRRPVPSVRRTRWPTSTAL